MILERAIAPFGGVTIEEAIKDAEFKIANIPLIDSVEIATLKASYLNEVTE